MKGLFLKDWYGLLGMYKKNLMLLLSVYALLSLLLNMPFFLFLIPWLMGFYTLSSFSLDEACRWNLYARTMPISPRQVVGGKFLVAICWIIPASFYSAIVGCVICLINPGDTLPAEMLASSAVVAIVAIDMISILLTMSFHTGVEKARSLFFLFFVGLFLLFFLGGQTGLLDDANLALLVASMAAFPILWAIAAIALAVLIPVICFAVSCRIYAKKEF